MAGHRPFSEIAEEVRADPARRAKIEEQKQIIRAAVALIELRKRRGKTQADVARAMHVTRARVSQMEHGIGLTPVTLRDYVAALGGEFEVAGQCTDDEFGLGSGG